MLRALIPPAGPIPAPIPHLPPLVLQAVFFVALLTAASAFDIHRRIIPDSVCALVALTGLITFSPVRLFGVLAALPLLTAALCKRGSIGGGDIKLTAASGLVLGFAPGLAGLCAGLAAMLLFYAGRRIAGRIRKDGKSRNTASLPLAPFLAIGFLAAYFLNLGGL